MLGRRIVIEPVPEHRRRDGLTFLAGGEGPDAIGRARAELLARATKDTATDQVWLWWARRGRRTVAAAMVLGKSGRTGLLFISPSEAPGVRADALVRLVRAVSTEALGSGLYFVQSIQQAGRTNDSTVVEAAQYRFLAELIYMRKPLDSADRDRWAACEPARVGWRHYGQYGEAELGELISRTYEGSLDCPAISGARTMEDVIAGHKSGGSFRPDAWWIVTVDGSPAGCVLANDHLDSTEIVYMGVVPERRGMGLSATMLAKAAADAAGRGLGSLTLAVDAANSYALEAYRRFGFVETDRRAVYVATAEAHPRPPEDAGC